MDASKIFKILEDRLQIWFLILSEFKPIIPIPPWIVEKPLTFWWFPEEKKFINLLKFDYYLNRNLKKVPKVFQNISLEIISCRNLFDSPLVKHFNSFNYTKNNKYDIKYVSTVNQIEIYLPRMTVELYQLNKSYHKFIV